jgi:dienelactone hydrolase
MAFAVALALAAAGAFALRFALDLPKPTGPQSVGTMTLTLERPPEPEEPAPGEYDVQVWYPAQPAADRAPYGTGSAGFRNRIYHYLVRTNAARNAAVARGPRRFPILVYIAGWGGERTSNTILAENLASHGFVVAAFGDVEHDRPPLGRLAGPAAFGSERAYEATLRLGHERLQYEARRASAVLDRLTALDADDPSGRFTHRLDVARVGAVGYSFGGAVALEACRRDARFKAAMNLDGWLFDAGSGYRGGVPYFLASDRSPDLGASDVAAAEGALRYTNELTVADQARQHEVLRHGGYSLRIADADHYSFTDVPFIAPLHRFGNRGAQQKRIALVVCDYAVAFFERALNGTPSALLVPTDKLSRRMTLVSWPLEGLR